MKIVLRLLAAAACAALGAGLLTGCGAQEEKFEERLYTADACGDTGFGNNFKGADSSCAGYMSTAAQFF